MRWENWDRGGTVGWTSTVSHVVYMSKVWDIPPAVHLGCLLLFTGDIVSLYFPPRFA